MSLLQEAYEPCTLIDKTTRPDGYGGVKPVWVDGATIQAAISYNNSMQARTAATQGTTAVFTIITEKNINLQYHDVLRRERDGKIFRVKSDGDDNRTPASASLNMRAVSAEEWSLPDE